MTAAETLNQKVQIMIYLKKRKLPLTINTTEEVAGRLADWLAAEKPAETVDVHRKSFVFEQEKEQFFIVFRTHVQAYKLNYGNIKPKKYNNKQKPNSNSKAR